MNRIATKLGRLEFNSPVTVASGTFDLENLSFLSQDYLGAFVCKTITRHAKIGNPPPRLYESEAGLINSIGLQNPGLDVFVTDYLPRLREALQIPLIVSFSGSSINEFSEILARLEDEEGIAGYELNVSCPNVENEGIAFGVHPDVVYDLCHTLSSHTKRELSIKLTPNVTDIAAIAQAAEAGGVSSIALINTLLGMAIDYKTGRSQIKKGIGGYSGIGIKPVALALTYKTAMAVNIPILAMGGIYTWQDALEFFWAGASMVALGTANFMDPLAVQKVVQGLSAYLTEKDWCIGDIIGKCSV
ncbi:MAG: dihydroorotate dehydrogenase [Candidatus Cloacimonetes bacterium]|nr:dihydroorotate dehydrogenase [Candidatus Cloacimonadota bacterium]